MYQGKNDEMPCGNTAAEHAHNDGYSEEGQDLLENGYEMMKVALTEKSLEDPDIFWEAIGLDGAKNKEETAKQLVRLLVINTEESLLEFGLIVKRQIYSYAESGINEEAWDSAFDFIKGEKL